MNKFISVALTLSGFFHVLAFIWPAISMPEPLSEHALFAAVNFFLARMVWRLENSDPDPFTVRFVNPFIIGFVLAFALQQSQRHGQAIAELSKLTTLSEVQVLVQSVFAIISMCGLFLWLVLRLRL